jgi:hypothetical protein
LVQAGAVRRRAFGSLVRRLGTAVKREKTPSMASGRQSIGMIASGFATSLTAAGAAFSLGGLTAGLLFIVALALAALTLFTPELVTLIGISALYLNLPGIATTVYGLPKLLAAAVYLLLAVPVLVRLLLRREAVRVDRPLLLIVAFFGASLLSFFVVEDLEAATMWLTDFLVEGLVLYFLVLNLFRTLEGLRRVLYVLMICGALLGGLTLYQEATHSYTQQFSGLAQRNIEDYEGEEDWVEKENPFRNPDKVRLSERAGGPLDSPNRYAQILVVLLPLAYFGMQAQRKLLFRLACAVCGALVLAGALLTYSRGAFVGIVVLLALLKWMGSIRLRALGLFVGVVVIAMIAWTPGYILRVETLGGVPGVVQETPSGETDNVILGRITENLAALNLFLDHPLVGVGVGQYTPVYSVTYMNNPDIALRHITTKRRSHTLYFELAAETGLVGIAIFLGVVGLILSRLWRAWRHWRVRRPDLAGLAAGFFLSIVGYLVTAVFLQLSYQRYYWLLLGLAGAALQILSGEDRRSERFEDGGKHSPTAAMGH